MSVRPLRWAPDSTNPAAATQPTGNRALRLVPRRWRNLVRRLVDEQARIGTVRPATTVTNHETYVRSKGTTGSAKVLRLGAARLEPAAGKIDETEAEMARLRKQITHLDQTPVTGPAGEIMTASQAATKQGELATQVQKETAAGSAKHLRVAPNELKRLRRLTWLDFPVLLFFFASFFNVDWQALGSLERDGLVGNLVNLLFAAVFAALGTRLSALGMDGLGRYARRFKNDQGQLALPRGTKRILPLVSGTLAVLVVLGLSTVMAYRIVEEAANAGVGGVGPVLLGITYAALVALINILLVVRTFQDGSELTDQIDHLSSQLAPVRQKQHDLRQRIDKLEAARAVRAGKAIRLAAIWRCKASEPVQAADQVILLARGIHQGRGSEAPPVELGKQPPHGLLPPAPAVDSSPLAIVLARIDAADSTNTAGSVDRSSSEGNSPAVAVNGSVNGHQKTLHITVGLEGNDDQKGASS